MKKSMPPEPLATTQHKPALGLVGLAALALLDAGPPGPTTAFLWLTF